MTYKPTQAPAQPAQQQPTKTVVFGGRVTKDPELRMNGDTPVINIDFAVNQLNGETHWGRATIWGTDAYIAQDFCRKGEMIAGVADFKVTSREYNNQTYQNNEYNVKSLFLSTKDILAIVDSKIEAAVKPQPVAAEAPQPQAPTQPTGFSQPAPVAEPQEEAPKLQIDDDNLPF